MNNRNKLRALERAKQFVEGNVSEWGRVPFGMKESGEMSITAGFPDSQHQLMDQEPSFCLCRPASASLYPSRLDPESSAKFGKERPRSR